MANEDYAIYNFYVICILHITLPFILLLVLNVLIVALMKRKLYGNFGGSRTRHGDMPQIAFMMRKGSKTMERKAVRIFQSRSSQTDYIELNFDTLLVQWSASPSLISFAMRLAYS